MGMISVTVDEKNLGSVVTKLSVNFTDSNQGTSVYFRRVSKRGEPTVFGVYFDNVLLDNGVADSIRAENLVKSFEHAFGS